MMMVYQEKNIFLMKLSSNLTASSARILFESRLPLCEQLVLMKGGVWERVNEGKSTHLMFIADYILMEEIQGIIQFIVSWEDVTYKLINPQQTLKPRILLFFNYHRFEKFYNEIYLKETPVEHALKKIRVLGDKSRKLDQQVVRNYILKR